MANLKSISELAYRQVFPYKGDETPNMFAEFLETAKLLYATKVWEINRADKASGMGDEVPSHLLSKGELQLNGKYANFEHLTPLLSLPKNSWIQALGSYDCGSCEYDIMTLNDYKLFCKDESRSGKAAIVIGKEIHFPDGAYTNPIPIVYANLGEDTDDNIEVDDAIGGMIRVQLFELYSKKFPVDKTNNSNPNN